MQVSGRRFEQLVYMDDHVFHLRIVHRAALQQARNFSDDAILDHGFSTGLLAGDYGLHDVPGGSWCSLEFTLLDLVTLPLCSTGLWAGGHVQLSVGLPVGFE